MTTHRSSSVERRAHKILADKRLNGEWFDVTLDEAVAAIKMATQAHCCKDCEPAKLKPPSKIKQSAKLKPIDKGMRKRIRRVRTPDPNFPFIRARVPADLKTAGEAVLRREGVTQQQALEMFWRCVVDRGGFPWEINQVP